MNECECREENTATHTHAHRLTTSESVSIPVELWHWFLVFFSPPSQRTIFFSRLVQGDLPGDIHLFPVTIHFYFVSSKLTSTNSNSFQLISTHFHSFQIHFELISISHSCQATWRVRQMPRSVSPIVENCTWNDSYDWDILCVFVRFSES